MEAATISQRTIEIDGMSGDACVQKVTGVLKNVHGVSTQCVKIGHAKIGADEAGCAAACAAIRTAGFQAHEDTSVEVAGEPTRATQKDPSGFKGGHQPASQHQNSGAKPLSPVPGAAANGAPANHGKTACGTGKTDASCASTPATSPAPIVAPVAAH